jgi:hypothetical protein
MSGRVSAKKRRAISARPRAVEVSEDALILVRLFVRLAEPQAHVSLFIERRDDRLPLAVVQKNLYAALRAV